MTSDAQNDLKSGAKGSCGTRAVSANFEVSVVGIIAT